jgi:hypothetical protein
VLSIKCLSLLLRPLLLALLLPTRPTGQSRSIFTSRSVASLLLVIFSLLSVIYADFTINQQREIHSYNRNCSAHQYVTNDMTDDIQSQTKKEDTKSSSASNRGPKRQSSNPSNLRGGSSGARPVSRGSIKKAPTTTTSAAESGSDTASRKGDGNNRKQDQRGKNQNGSGRGLPHRKAQASTSHVARNVGSNKPSSSPGPAQSAESSDALSSLQRVIQDLKTSSPAQQSTIGSQGV